MRDADEEFDRPVRAAAASGGGLDLGNLLEQVSRLQALLNNPVVQRILKTVGGLLGRITDRHPGAPVVAPPPQPPPVPPPPAPPHESYDYDIDDMDGRLYYIEEPERYNPGNPRGHFVDAARAQAINTPGADAKADDGSRLHLDWSPKDRGQVFMPDDSRWPIINRHWSPNGAPIWTGYEFNGQITDGPNGEPGQGHQEEDVAPESVVDDGWGRMNGCTPVYLCNAKGRYRFLASYKQLSGGLLRFIMGRGNQTGALDQYTANATGKRLADANWPEPYTVA